MQPRLGKIPNNLLEINYDLDYEYLEEVAYTLTRKKFYFKGELAAGYTYAPWEDEVLDEIVKIFEPKGRYNFKFVFLQPFTKLPWHSDKGTKSAVIWKLSGDEVVEFRDKSYSYKTAIVDTSKEHRVQVREHERILFKLSCFDTTYEELASTFAKKFMYGK